VSATDDGRRRNRPRTAECLVLLAAVEADTRSMYAEYLRYAKYQIEEAADGREALAKAIDCRPAAIVTAIRLPGLSGVELCRLLRSHASTSTTPIIVIASEAFSGDVRQASAAGANTALVLPCLPDRLEAEIRQLIARSAESDGPSACRRERRDYRERRADVVEFPRRAEQPGCDEAFDWRVAVAFDRGRA
jgi:DNA-binding response OmpR family regulator